LSALLEAALRYAELGYRVFPCAPGAKTPLTRHGFHDATTDIEQIERWWSQHPNANIGIPTAGLVVIDIDGETNPWLADDHERMLELASAPMSITPRGGRHYLFRQSAGKHWRCTESRLAPKVDTRAEGGYIIAPPSVVESGKTYRWAPGLELDAPPDRLPEPPLWLIQELDRLANGSPRLAHVTAGEVKSNPIQEGQRNDTLTRLAGTMRRAGMSRREIAAALQQANKDRCQPPLDPREVDRIAASIAGYEPDERTVDFIEGRLFSTNESQIDPIPEDPGPIPIELLRIPGFVSEVMDFSMKTAPYPNQALAFCGALALQAFLGGRKVRDQGDVRTNLYLLSLAYSSSGKDWPRKVNTKIIHAIGCSQSLGEHFASGEGLQDALFLTPCMLFQTDEIDILLQSINKAKDARYENILSTLLTMYSASNTIFTMRRKAGKEHAGTIEQPCLVIYGTAIPTHYYAALSERMLTNGFFARMLIVEAGKRGEGQEPKIADIPQRILEIARYWADFNPGTGNLEKFYPTPRIVHHTDEALAILAEARRQCDAEYNNAESRKDAVGTTVWGRTNENTRKLALIHAISANHREPVIDEQAAKWAINFAMHQTRRMLFMAQNNVAENPFHAECLKVLKRLQESPDKTMPHCVLLKRMKLDSQTFQRVIETLEQQGDVQTILQTTGGRPQRAYRLTWNLPSARSD
jgi:hypothetical protein